MATKPADPAPAKASEPIKQQDVGNLKAMFEKKSLPVDKPKPGGIKKIFEEKKEAQDTRKVF